MSGTHAIMTHNQHRDRALDAAAQRAERGARPCTICSSEEVPVRHQHFSSRWLRQITGVEESNASHICPSCKSHHRPYPYPRSKLVLSDSTLHLFFSPPGQTSSQYSGDLMHVDYITIPGASINALTRAFRYEFVDVPQVVPIDVVVAAGYDELVTGCSRVLIMERFRYLVQTVLEAGSPDHKNTVAISDLVYPPMLTWFPDNGNLPADHQGNQLVKLEWLNEAILSLNLDNSITEFHRLHKYGIRVCTKRRVDQYGQEHHRMIKCHRFEHWVEQNASEKLHLKDEIRFKIGAGINKYFQLRTEWETD